MNAVDNDFKVHKFHAGCGLRNLADHARSIKIPPAVKLVYVAGPYTGETWQAVEDNIQLSRWSAAEMGRHGIAYVAPCLNSAHMETILGADDPGYEFWIKMTGEILKRCDAIFMVPGWEKSNGARAEFQWAIEHQLPAFVMFEALRSWYFK